MHLRERVILCGIMALILLIFSVEEKENDGVEDLKEEYLKAFKDRDSGRMAAIIKQGISMEVLREEHPMSSFDAAACWAALKDDYVLMDALLARTDIRGEAQKMLFYVPLNYLAFGGTCCVKVLQYLDSHGANIKKICHEAEYNILIEVLRYYTVAMSFEGNDKCKELCKELCEIIDFFISKGVDTVSAYMELAHCKAVGDYYLYFNEDCHDEVAKRLKPKGGRKWKFRG
jgi:hypothetical protein